MPAGVAVNRPRIGISASRTARTRAISRMASSESPPRSKKLSSAPTRSRPRTSANRPQTISSAAVRGSRLIITPPNSGAGSAARSSFPLTVTGSASKTTRAAGTMYSGSRRRHVLAQLLAVTAPARRDDVADQALLAGLVLPRDDRGLRDGRVGGQHGLDLAGLDPEPADLDLLIRPAREHQLAVVVQRARSPVRYMRAPGAGRTGRR